MTQWKRVLGLALLSTAAGCGVDSEATTAQSESIGMAQREVNREERLAGAYTRRHDRGPIQALVLGKFDDDGDFKNKFYADIDGFCDGRDGNGRDHDDDDDDDHGDCRRIRVKGRYHADRRVLELEPDDDAPDEVRFLLGEFRYDLDDDDLLLTKTDGFGFEMELRKRDSYCRDDDDCDDHGFSHPECRGDGEWSCERRTCEWTCEEPDEPERPWFCHIGIDNVCALGPRTPPVGETWPGGLCDPNGDGGYDDADWEGGWWRYQQLCVH